MKDIEQILRENKPQAPAEGQFMIETNARLNNVEGIRQTVEAERRRGRVALVAALVAGLVIGCLVTLFAMLYPIHLPALNGTLLPGDGGFLARAAEYLRDYRAILFAAIASCAIALGLVLTFRKREAL